jgi:hypothetical protein
MYSTAVLLLAPPQPRIDAIQMTSIKTSFFGAGPLALHVSVGSSVERTHMTLSEFSQARLILRPFIGGSGRILPPVAEKLCRRQA